MRKIIASYSLDESVCRAIETEARRQNLKGSTFLNWYLHRTLIRELDEKQTDDSAKKTYKREVLNELD